MKGYEVLAKSLRECADQISAIPGFPVTELAKEADASRAIGEKVAIEYALGHSLSGKRSVVIMKNVGLNACADPLIHATTQGLIGGVVVVTGDDPAAAGSTNAQDSRYYGEIGQFPVVEPGAETCSRSVEVAFSASEQFSRIALIRVTPELLFNEAVIEPVCRGRGRGKLAPPDLTMKGRADWAAGMMPDMFAWSSQCNLNRLRGGTAGVGPVRGDSQIVTVYPPPHDLKGCLVVREIGRPFVQEHRDLSPPGANIEPETVQKRGYTRTFCRECPFLVVLEILKKKELSVIADAGCSILALNLPFRIARASYGLGTAIGVAAQSTRLALIGDYALIHSGLQSLIDVYEKGIPLLCIVLDNRCMAMTGGQETPDPYTYLTWAEPVRIRASELTELNRHITLPERPQTVIVEGTCPEGRHHEIMEC
jgi:indolepyruvate ferredoxin oxidoreductase alpha subunit